MAHRVHGSSAPESREFDTRTRTGTERTIFILTEKQMKYPWEITTL